MTIEHKDYIAHVRSLIRSAGKQSRTKLESYAQSIGITDKTIIKELTELAIVMEAREVALNQELSQSEKYDRIVDIYQNQANLSFRTSQSILLQQYSTPAPIGFLAGIYTEPSPEKYLFEPSAGNGLLTIAWPIRNVWVNEIDENRYHNLNDQGYQYIFNKDATEEIVKPKSMDAMITNPPFGVMAEAETMDRVKIKTLDHFMVLKALETLKDDGKAACIIGGHTEWDSKGRVQSGKNRIFFNYLYKHYNVEDVININGKTLYSRQGTAFNTRLILINGRKSKPEGVAPLKGPADTTVKTFDQLYTRVTQHLNSDMKSAEAIAKALELELEMEFETGLGGPYMPTSDSCNTLDVYTPDSMDFEIHQAAARIKKAVGSFDVYVREKLGYKSDIALCKSLASEQIDGVAMAIYNIEQKSQGIIIGDQTGIGKGRQAAAMIRYGVEQGLKPIFISEKPNLFSDIYRDLEDIGSSNLKPFIVNRKETKTVVKDKSGNIVHVPEKSVQDKFFADPRALASSDYDFVMATYSQFNKNKVLDNGQLETDTKGRFLLTAAGDNLIILDESHNAGGSSNTGSFFQEVLTRTKGVVFLSATFAKRPDNMPLYAMKTAMTDANMTKPDLVEAITKGGVALQEVLASQLVNEGQMIRRERTFEGINVNYLTLDDLAPEHKAISDNVTSVIREIIGFQTNHIKPHVDDLDTIAAGEGSEVDIRGGTDGAGVDNMPYFSKVFNVINQMLFSIKANSVAERAILRLKQGKKPVIAFASTMESFVDDMGAAKGDTIPTDFSLVLKKGLESVMKITTTDEVGEKTFEAIDLHDLDSEAQSKHLEIIRSIEKMSTGITISPIDWIKKKIEDAGFKVAEVTGRKSEIQLNKTGTMGVLMARKKLATNDAFRMFNDNEVDVLMINQSGSTGASAHAVPTPKVPKEMVKPRVMIILQAELDINREVQKRGRINRTGQIFKPEYDYMTSAIPAEQRLMMMLQKKLKSLDANTTSNQKQNKKMIDIEDFLNKYGDQVVFDHMTENIDWHDLLGNPLKSHQSEDTSPATGNMDGAAHKVSGRVAVLSSDMQEQFYKDISERYNSLVNYLKQTDEYDLEVEALDLNAETKKRQVVKVGKNASSVFGADSYLETVEANVLKKPYSETELKNLVQAELSGMTPEEYSSDQVNQMMSFLNEKKFKSEKNIFARFSKQRADITNRKKVKDAKTEDAAKALIREFEDKIDEAERVAIKESNNRFENIIDMFNTMMEFFKPSMSLRIPAKSFDGSTGSKKGVFIGWDIDPKRDNPYAPSAVRARIAFADSTKYIAYPLSGDTGNDVRSIIGESSSLNMWRLDTRHYEQWSALVSEGSNDRSTRFIVTGNLLQAFTDYQGKLVSYTTIDEKIVKGILMPENWTPKEQGEEVKIPIIRALSIINGTSIGSFVSSGDLALFRTPSGWKLLVPASKSRGGKFYLNEALLQIVGNFSKISDKMQAEFTTTQLESVVRILNDTFAISIEISQAQYNNISDQFEKYEEKEVLEIPKKAMQDNAAEKEAQAVALALELEMEMEFELELAA